MGENICFRSPYACRRATAMVPFGFAHFVVTQWNQDRLTAHHEQLLNNLISFNAVIK